MEADKALVLMAMIMVWTWLTKSIPSAKIQQAEWGHLWVQLGEYVGQLQLIKQRESQKLVLR